MLLTKDEIVGMAIPPAPLLCGVYFLVDGGEIVYVGQSTDVFSRINAHCRSDKKFDSYAFVACPEEILSEVEAAYIVQFAPKYNGNLPSNTTWLSGGRLRLWAKQSGIGAWALKKYIRDNDIQDTNGYYRISDFADLGMARTAL